MMSNWTAVAREQQQLFMLDWGYLSDLLFQVGGVSSILAGLLVQFFYNPAVAVASILFVAALSAAGLWIPYRKAAGSLPLLALPFVAVLLLSGQQTLHFDAVIAFTLASLSFALFRSITSRKWAWGLLITLVLYLVAGPASLIFAISALLDAIAAGDKHSAVTCAAMTLEASILCLISYLCGLVPEIGDAFGPSFFLEPTSEIDPVSVVAWFSLPVSAFLMELLSRTRRPVALCVSAACALVVVLVAVKLPVTKEQEAIGRICQYEYLCNNERWADLEKSTRPFMFNYVDANYHNLALAKQGKLLDELFNAPQHTPQSLLNLPKDNTSNPVVARVLMAMGDVAAAQNVAFNSMQSFCGYNPEMVRIVAQVDMMRGSYSVASKYLDLLSKAPHYRAWAESQRSFLGDDEAVLNDPVLGNGRRNLQCAEGFVINPSPLDDMMRILEVNPEDRGTMEYALAFLLLAKDMAKVQEFVDRFYGSPALMSLPVPAQEALLFYSDYSANVLGDTSFDRDYCLSHGVAQSTVSRFEKFQQETLNNSGKAPQSFRNTYWYYMLYE